MYSFSSLLDVFYANLFAIIIFMEPFSIHINKNSSQLIKQLIKCAARRNKNKVRRATKQEKKA